MNNISNLSNHMKKISIFLFLFSVFVFPLTTFGATKTNASATIDMSSLTSTLEKPTITGTATGTKSIKISIYKENSKKVLYKKSTVKVRDGIWKAKISKKLSNGTYKVSISGANRTTPKILATGTLTIDKGGKLDKKSDSNLVVSSIPLLSGGNAKSGASVPISYLQVNNAGKETIIVKGFWIKQNGSAPAQSVAGFNVVDDQGVTRGSIGSIENPITFSNNMAYIPINEMPFMQQEMRLFTIKAMLGKDAYKNIGKQLMLDVSSIETNATSKGDFPIRGTTWTIIN